MFDHEFDKFINKDSKILILGSFPSVKSRQESFYYMHKTNRFYKVLASIFNDKSFLSEDINIKKEALKKHSIALFDVVLKCNILLSDDNTISEVTPINLKNILKHYPIKKIIINGNKAKSLYLTYFKDVKIETYFLPSTSARNANYSLEKLIDCWKIICK